MTSERVDRQIQIGQSGQPEVKQDVDALGSHDRLNEAPLLYSQRCGLIRLVEEYIAPRPIAAFVNVITALDAMGLMNRAKAREMLREGQPSQGDST